MGLPAITNRRLATWEVYLQPLNGRVIPAWNVGRCFPTCPTIPPSAMEAHLFLSYG
jgi:hypothetical protein